MFLEMWRPMQLEQAECFLMNTDEQRPHRLMEGKCLLLTNCAILSKLHPF